MVIPVTRAPRTSVHHTKAPCPQGALLIALQDIDYISIYSRLKPAQAALSSILTTKITGQFSPYLWSLPFGTCTAPGVRCSRNCRPQPAGPFGHCQKHFRSAESPQKVTTVGSDSLIYLAFSKHSQRHTVFVPVFSSYPIIFQERSGRSFPPPHVHLC